MLRAAALENITLEVNFSEVSLANCAKSCEKTLQHRCCHSRNFLLYLR